MYNYNPYDSFFGYYVNDYSTVLNTPVQTNGNASIFVDLNQGLLWSKKSINGQTFIQPYTIKPINNEGNIQPTQDNPLNQIMNKLNSLESEIIKMKGENNESKSNVNVNTNGSIKE